MAEVKNVKKKTTVGTKTNAAKSATSKSTTKSPVKKTTTTKAGTKATASKAGTKTVTKPTPKTTNKSANKTSTKTANKATPAKTPAKNTSAPKVSPTKVEPKVVTTKASTEKVKVKETAAKKKSTPTPKRATQQKKNVRPLVAPPAKNLSKDERSQLRQEQRVQASDLRAKEQKALHTGDQKFLPPRDQGPVKRFVREQVDAKRTPLEFFIFGAVIMLILSIATQSLGLPDVMLAITVVTYIYIICSVLHAFIIINGIKKQVRETFGNKKENLQGVTSYAFYRLTQPKKLRLPKVGV